MVTANELWLSTTSATVSVSISVSVTFRSLMAFSQLRSCRPNKRLKQRTCQGAKTYQRNTLRCMKIFILMSVDLYVRSYQRNSNDENIEITLLESKMNSHT